MFVAVMEDVPVRLAVVLADDVAVAVDDGVPVCDAVPVCELVVLGVDVLEPVLLLELVPV